MNTLNSKWLKRMEACPMPIEMGHSTTSVAVTDTHNEFLLEKIRQELQATETVPKTFPGAPPSRICPVELNAAQIRQMIASDCSSQRETDITEESLKNDSKSWESEPIINLVDSLLESALKQGATDIHLEPSASTFRIRFRKDGLLEDFRKLPQWVEDPVLVRLKVLSDIDITDRRIPHDGSFTYSGFTGVANIRVSTLPVQGGEKCVLRLLPQKEDSNATETLDNSSLFGLAKLSLSPKITDALRTIFNEPQGLFLVTGPTGSGKTTTLHAGLEEIIRKKINVVTVEDPVEYTLPGANQVQVNEKCGFTFAEALRSILRQDPDVILVGEIRDSETAQIAMRAAQTGHLVLSTLHTNSAKGAETRLMDLGIPQYLIKESLLGVMSQRLFRKVNGGRIATVELLLPSGNFVDGTIQDCASRLIRQGTVNKSEVQRVLGNLCYIEPHENF